jgi:phosphatidylserine/phosphatidylglycerophosphate/cardiolipin synthase-like enzyme
LLALALLLAFSLRTGLPGEPSPAGAESHGSIQVYFSAPGSAAAQSLRGGPDAPLAAAIADAQQSVDMAIYDLDLWSVRDALLAAHRRGVQVRLVTEKNNAQNPEIAELELAGVPVVVDGESGLMHHKFVVIDGQAVWTGSMNLTVNGAYRNDNNLVLIRSPHLAANYLREFEEMFLERRFGPRSRRDTPYPSLRVSGDLVEVAFSPEDGALERMLPYLRAAQSSIRMMAFTLTADPLAEVLLERHAAGVHVSGVVEAANVGAAGSDVPRLRREGIDLRLDGNPNSMHHKVLIIDGQIVIFGSYNFTRAAEEKNDENILIIHDPDLGRTFLIEFERVYRQALP